MVVVIIIIIIIIIIRSSSSSTSISISIIVICIICYLYKDIYNYVSKNTNFLGHVEIQLFCVYDLCYLPSMIAVPNMAFFCSSLMSYLPVYCSVIF